jgi:hypothetical protein
MKMRHMMFAVVGLAFALGQPMLAGETKIEKLTCKEFSAQKSDAMMKTTKEIKAAAEKDKKADPAKAKMSDEEIMKLVTKSCEGKPDMMAMEAMMAK